MSPTAAPRLWQPLSRRLFTTATAKISSASTSTAALHCRRPASTIPTPCSCNHLYRSPLGRRPLTGASAFSTSAPRRRMQPADDPNFKSILDNPPELVRSGRRHGPGLIILAIIPIAAFCLGTWQVFRLRWKTDLLAKCEDRLVQPPLPLVPDNVDQAALAGYSKDAESAFDYRRVVAIGTYRHDQEMLVGPRVREGSAGYLVITPLELAPDPYGKDPNATVTILVNRGWISREQRSQKLRRQGGRGAAALPEGLVKVEGMLRAPWKKNMFTPDNRPDKGEYYFPDVKQMAALTGSAAVWIQATMEPDLLQVYDMEAHGVPIGNPPEVNLRNTHAQYIFTWYSLCLATSIMLWMVTKKPTSDIANRVRMNKNW